jgi:uncharacterized protein DUF6535
LGEVKEDDRRITDARKEDANGILVFVSLSLLVSLFISMTSKKTGLFSATVGAFIIEFYKKLSPDSGDQTVALLGQISQQFANFPNGNYSSVVIQPPPPSASMIWVNAMWLISLVLSLTSAWIATLLQQWAGRYVETLNLPSEPNHRARVRSFLFLGTEFYKLPLVIEIVPTLLHLSVFLFFAGLAIAFHTINTKVAIAVDVSVGVFVLAYIMLSILPCLDVGCPYRTPLSYILWYPCHAFLSFTARCLHWLLMRLHGYVVEPSLDGVISSPWHLTLVDWLDSCEQAVEKHWRYLMDGIKKSVLTDAVDAREGDRKIITSLFSDLAQNDKSKLRKLAASIPRHRVRKLIRPVETEKLVLRDPLLLLLRSCEAGAPGETKSDEDARKHALLVCLDAIHDVSKTPSIPDLNFVRTNFANIGHMRTLWDDSDTTIRVTSRSICALVARQVIRGPLEQPHLRWLGELTSPAIFDTDVKTLDHFNLKSFVSGVLSKQVEHLPIEDAISFKETLAILLGVRSNACFDTKSEFQSRLSAEFRRMREDVPVITDDVVDKLHSMFPFLLETPAPTASNPVAFTRAASTQAASVLTSSYYSAPTLASSTHAAPTPASHTASTHSASTSASSTHAASLYHDPLAQV